MKIKFKQFKALKLFVSFILTDEGLKTFKALATSKLILNT